MTKFILGFLFLLYPLLSFSGVLNDTLSKYQSTPMLEAQVDKSVYTELLNKTKNQTGKIYLAKEKIKIEFLQPEKEMLLFDGSTLWTVQYLPEELGGIHQVSRTKIDKKNRSQILLGLLFDKSQFKKFFKLENEKLNENKKTYELKVLDPGLKINKLEIVINKEKKEILSITYFDDLKNKTSFNLSNQKFNSKFIKDLFIYVPPKDAQVTNL